MNVRLLIAAGIVGLVVLAVIRRALKRHGALSLLGWFLAGRDMDGQRRTDATWRRPGTRALTPHGHASRWAHRAGWHRTTARMAGALGTGAATWGLYAHRGATLMGLELLGAATATWCIWRAWRLVADWQHTRTWVKPLHIALGKPLGVPLNSPPRSWLEVPRGYAGREGAQITVKLPSSFSGGADAKRAITEIVSAKLALEDPRAAWQLAGREPQVTYTVQTPPPKRVSYAEVRELIAACTDTAPLAGLGRGGKPIHVDLDLDSPHAIFSMSSGTGKSVVLRTLVAQELARGAVALVLDIKRLSHAWARGLPNVRYCRDIAEIHDACIWLGEETDRRNQLADEGADIDGNTDHVDVGPRLIIVAEELNATSVRLASYWRRIKDKDDPSVSPAIEALGDVFFMGRQVKENILAVAQMFTARTVGGPEARENAGVRVLGGYTLNNWRMLVPEIWPAPKKSRIKGRVQICVAGEAKETQVVFLTPAEARELATSGTVAAFPAEGIASSPSSAPRLHVAGTAAPIGLRQAVAEGVVPISLEAVRSARARDPEFPEARTRTPGGEQLYDRDELASWARNRPRADTGS